MGLYCGPCEHLNTKKKKCEKFIQKLTFSKYSGAISYTVFEKCDECRNAEEMKGAVQK